MLRNKIGGIPLVCSGVCTVNSGQLNAANCPLQISTIRDIGGGSGMAESSAFARQASYLFATTSRGISLQETAMLSDCGSGVKRWHSTPMKRSARSSPHRSGVQYYSFTSKVDVNLYRAERGATAAGCMTLVSGQLGRSSRLGFSPQFFHQRGRLKNANFLKENPDDEVHCKSRHSMVRSASIELAGGIDIIGSLGLDSLTFLIATVLIVPAFKAVGASPILGFLLSGVVFNQLGLIRNVTDVKALSELGVLFLLFEMGLELSLVRLKALAKYALGIGLAQVIVSTMVFTAFELPTNNALGTRLLEFLFHARPDLVNIRTVDEAVVIGAGLSLSSSAFVLQLLAEKGELPTRFGSATLGILLLQDIVVVPLLVILPILESGNLDNEALWPKLAAESLKALLGLGILSFGGRFLLRRFFEVVANSRSTEAFVALCLLTVTGTSLLTQKLGFSDTLGAFLAGALLAETNYKTQVEADIRPFRGLLLGLFFVTTGTSIDLQLLYREWPNVLALLAGLLAIKTAIITAIGPRVGLTLPESVRTGLLLSQGGEFAFVVFSLANRLGVLPIELNRLLIIVVVLSMMLTPLLNEVGRAAATYLESKLSSKPGEGSMMQSVQDFRAIEPVVIIGFGQVGQVLANFLSTPLAVGLGGDGGGWPYVAFDLDPGRVRTARNLGFPVLYGDGSRPVVLQTAGIHSPKAVLVMYTGRQKSVDAVERLRHEFPTIPIYARSQDLGHLLELKTAGATDVILETTETSLQLGSLLLRGLGIRSDDVAFLRGLMRESMELRARETLGRRERKEEDYATEFQAKLRETWTTLSTNESIPSELQGLDSSIPKNPTATADKSGKNGSSDSRDGPLHFQTNDDELPLRLSSIDSHSGDGTAVEHAEQLQGSDGANPNVDSNIGVTGSGPVKLRRSGLSKGLRNTGNESSNNSSLEQLSAGNVAPSDSASAITKLRWRNALVLETTKKGGEDDERGVTICALPGDERYRDELEKGEKVDSIDETIVFVKDKK